MKNPNAIPHSVKLLCKKFYQKGFYGEKIPFNMDTGENEEFIIGCSLDSLEDVQRISFLPHDLLDIPEEYFSDDLLPQLIFGYHQGQLAGRLEAYPNDVCEMIWVKFTTAFDMYKMVEKLHELGFHLYPAQ